MSHVCLHQMTGCQRRAERQLACEDGCANNTGKASCVVARVGGVRSAHAKKVKHGRLSFEDCTAANGADFDTGHGDGDLKIATDARE